MANEYYNPSNAPATSSNLSSATMRAEFAAIGQAMDKMAPLSGNANEVVVVNAGATGQTSTPAATLLPATITTATSKATPVDADELPLADSAASFSLKKLTWANLKATIKTWYEGTSFAKHIADAGTAALPSITANGDTDTGVYFPAADTVGVSTAGTERVRVDSDGDVGIGTTSPSAGTRLHIYRDTSSTLYPVVENPAVSGSSVAAGWSFKTYNGTASTAQGYVALTGNSWTFAGYGANTMTVTGSGVGGTVVGAINAAGSLKFMTGGEAASNIRMTIDSTGNVGVGTSTPKSPLTVASNITSNDGGFLKSLYYSGGWKYSQNTVSLGFAIYSDAAGVSFSTAPAGGAVDATATPAERMRIDSAGRVGIGGTPSVDNLEVISTGNSTVSTSNTTSTVKTVMNATSLTGAVGTTSNHPFILATNNTERVRIDSTGRAVFKANGASQDCNVIINATNSAGTLFNEVQLTAVSSGGVGPESSFAVHTKSNAGVLSERMRIESTGNVGVGTTTANFGNLYPTAVRIIGVAGDGSANTTSYGAVALANNRATPAGSDIFGALTFHSTGATGSGTAPSYKAGIVAYSEGTGVGGVGGFGSRLVFNVRGDNASNIIEAMRIDSTGSAIFKPNGSTTVATVSTTGLTVTGALGNTGSVSGAVSVTTTNTDISVNSQASFIAVGNDTTARLIAYSSTHGSRPSSAWLTTTEASRPITIAPSGTAVGVYSSTGLAVTGNLTVTGTASAGSIELGYRDVPANSQGASYTLALTDRGKSIDFTGATAQTITIPANASVAFPVGATITVTNTTANNLSIAITTDTLRLAGTATTGTRTLAQYGVATMRKVSSTVWVISGAGLT